MDTTLVLALLVSGGLGVLIGYLLKNYLSQQDLNSSKQNAEKTLGDANSKAKEILLEAKNDALKYVNEFKTEEEKKREYLDSIENKLLSREEHLEKKISEAEKRKLELEQTSERAKKLREEAEQLKEMQKFELEKVASLSKEEAKAMLLKEVEETSKKDIAETIQKAENELKKELKEKAKFMIADAIQKYAAEVATESTATVVALTSDDMKGRIIGKEGRNVIAFEQATGVDVIIDDTPGSIVLSGFDLVRRYIAKVALEKLMHDGRIHPARIEEVVEKTKDEVEILMKELGEKAAFDTSVASLPPNLIKLLGRLKFRTSHGQNVLKHSMEVSYIAGALAGELGADLNTCRKAGLLHDIGKAVNHEVPGHHSIVGRDILKKFDLPKAVIHCVESHEGDIEPETLEAMIVAAANKIAIARPGAHKDNLDNYIKRLEELESAATSFDGVESSFAVQAGHEVRIFVKPEVVDDYAAVKLIHDIARKIEKDMQFPGQVKVNLIREVRAEGIAK